MAVDKEDRGQYWVDGQFTVRLRGLGSEPSRILRVRRPFALIGRAPTAEIRIDDPTVDDRHAVLILDRRGIFGVDLLSRSGTRFAGAEAASAWLGAGDILEVAGRRVEILQLRIDGSARETTLSNDDPLSDSPGLVDLSLQPMDAPAPPWQIASALAFVGRGDACAIRVDDPSVETTHCAMLRNPSSVHVLDLVGDRVRINDQPVHGSSPLLDGDILTIGEVRFAVTTRSKELLPEDDNIFIYNNNNNELIYASRENRIQELAIHDSDRVVGLNSQGALVAMLLEALGRGRESTGSEVLEVLRQFQADTATLFEAQIGRIETMNQEISRLREEIRGHLGPPPEPAVPLQLDLVPPPVATSAAPADWLLDRLNTLETETRSSWKDLLGRITATISPKQSAQTSKSLRLTDPYPGPASRS